MRELTQNELHEVNGGVDWEKVGIGVGIVSLGIVIAGTAGLATVPISILGAATTGEIFVALASLVSSGAGGVVIGYGVSSE